MSNKPDAASNAVDAPRSYDDVRDAIVDRAMAKIRNRPTPPPSPEPAESPELLPCEHCGTVPQIERAESGVIWIALIRHAPKCFWATWMMNREQVLLERGFTAWNTRARVPVSVQPTTDAVEVARVTKHELLVLLQETQFRIREHHADGDYGCSVCTKPSNILERLEAMETKIRLNMNAPQQSEGRNKSNG